MIQKDMPAHVWRDLAQEAEYKPEEIAIWTAREVFEKWCTWHGLINWSDTLWDVVLQLAKPEDIKDPVTEDILSDFD